MNKPSDSIKKFHWPTFQASTLERSGQSVQGVKSKKTEKPKILILTQCLGDPQGSTAQSRVWQWLKIASQTHEIFLASLFEQPANFHQWQSVNQIASRIVLEKPRLKQQYLAKILSPTNQCAAQQLKYKGTLKQAIDTWKSQTDFDIVLATHPALWTLAMSVKANHRICDLYIPFSILHENAANEAYTNPKKWRWWHQHQSYYFRQLEKNIANQSDLIVVEHALQKTQLNSLAGHIKALPHSIDLSFFRKRQLFDRQDKMPNIVFHADWSSSKSFHDWHLFRKIIWPSISKALPNIRLTASDAKPLDDTLTNVAKASVIVSSVTDASKAFWPILQSMAFARPIITAKHHMRHTEMIHGKHLLLANRKCEWIDLCIHAIESAKTRMSLGHQARQFAINYQSTATSNHTLENLLATSQLDNSIMPHAA